MMLVPHLTLFIHVGFLPEYWQYGRISFLTLGVMEDRTGMNPCVSPSSHHGATAVQNSSSNINNIIIILYCFCEH